MDYEADQKMEETVTPGLGDQKAPIEKKPLPSCMREHIDQLQANVDDLRTRLHSQDKRILKLEELVG